MSYPLAADEHAGGRPEGLSESEPQLNGSQHKHLWSLLPTRNLTSFESDRPTSCRNSLIRTLAKCWVRGISRQHPCGFSRECSLPTLWMEIAAEASHTSVSLHICLDVCTDVLFLAIPHSGLAPVCEPWHTPHLPLTPSLTP